MEKLIKDLKSKTLYEIDILEGFQNEEIPHDKEIMKEVKKIFDKVTDATKNYDKRKCININNHDIFSLIILSTNELRVFEDIYYIDQILIDYINNWNIKDLKQVIQKIELNSYLEGDKSGRLKNIYITSNEYRKEFAKLGIPYTLGKESVYGAIKGTMMFVELKEKLKGIDSITGLEKTKDSEKINLAQQFFENCCGNLLEESIEEGIALTEEQIRIKEETYKYAIKVYKEILKLIEENKISSIKKVDEKLINTLELPILNILFEIANINLYYENKEIDDKLDSLKKMVDKSKLTKFLYMNKINISSLPEERIVELEKLSYSEVEQTLKLFMNMEYSINNVLTENYELFCDYLKGIKVLSNLIRKNVLTYKTIKNNINDIIPNIEKIKLNYEILKKFGVDLNDRNYNDKILLENPQIIQKKLYTLSRYNIKKNLQVYLICNYEYLGYLDLIIENEIPYYLLINICESVNPLNTIKKILIYKELGFEYVTYTHTLLEEIHIPEQFICPDSELDEYMNKKYIDSVLLRGRFIEKIEELEIVKLLDSKYQKGDKYIIGDTIISRTKVLKNISFLKERNIDIESHIMECLLSNSFTREQDILNISKTKKVISR